jgi:beta-xylosidase
VAFSVEGKDVGGMAARDPSGGIQVIVYNGQNPGNGPSDDKYYDNTEPENISISLSGLNPEVAYNVTMHRVDDTRGNAYAEWEGMGRPKMDAMSDADWQALRDAMVSPAEPVGQALCGTEYKQVVSLPSPGVAFLTLTPAVP